eukprot:m51a1_g7332 hypothetical protein (338) ;mRNA; f:183194-184611
MSQLANDYPSAVAGTPRVVLFGFGRMGRFRFGLFDETGAVDCAAVVDPAMPGRSVRAQRRAVDVPTFARLADVPRASYDAVWVSCPTVHHPSAIRDALAAGVKMIYCEKMIAFDEEKVRECYALCRAAGAQLFCGWMRRHDKHFCKLASEVQQVRASGDEIVYLRLVSKDWPKVDPKFLKTLGSIFEDLMCHDFSLVDLFLEGRMPCTVEAGGSDTTGADIWDIGWARLQYPGGLSVLLESYRFGDGKYDNTATVVTRSGRVLRSDVVEAMTFMERYHEAFTAEVLWYGRALRGEAPPRRVSPRTCEMVARLVDLTEQAAKVGHPVNAESGAPAAKL